MPILTSPFSGTRTDPETGHKVGGPYPGWSAGAIEQHSKAE